LAEWLIKADDPCIYMAKSGRNGESVTEPEEVAPALRRGLEQVRNGFPAVIAAQLPTLVEEMRLS